MTVYPGRDDQPPVVGAVALSMTIPRLSSRPWPDRLNSEDCPLAGEPSMGMGYRMLRQLPGNG
jgi:hypothetical protein